MPFRKLKDRLKRVLEELDPHQPEPFSLPPELSNAQGNPNAVPLETAGEVRGLARGIDGSSGAFAVANGKSGDVNRFPLPQDPANPKSVFIPDGTAGLIRSVGKETYLFEIPEHGLWHVRKEDVFIHGDPGARRKPASLIIRAQSVGDEYDNVAHRLNSLISLGYKVTADDLRKWTPQHFQDLVVWLDVVEADEPLSQVTRMTPKPLAYPDIGDRFQVNAPFEAEEVLVLMQDESQLIVPAGPITVMSVENRLGARSAITIRFDGNDTAKNMVTYRVPMAMWVALRASEQISEVNSAEADTEQASRQDPARELKSFASHLQLRIPNARIVDDPSDRVSVGLRVPVDSEGRGSEISIMAFAPHEGRVARPDAFLVSVDSSDRGRRWRAVTRLADLDLENLLQPTIEAVQTEIQRLQSQRQASIVVRATDDELDDVEKRLMGRGWSWRETNALRLREWTPENIADLIVWLDETEDGRTSGTPPKTLMVPNAGDLHLVRKEFPADHGIVFNYVRTGPIVVVDSAHGGVEFAYHPRSEAYPSPFFVTLERWIGLRGAGTIGDREGNVSDKFTDGRPDDPIEDVDIHEVLEPPQEDPIEDVSIDDVDNDREASIVVRAAEVTSMDPVRPGDLFIDGSVVGDRDGSVSNYEVVRALPDNDAESTDERLFQRIEDAAVAAKELGHPRDWIWLVSKNGWEKFQIPQYGTSHGQWFVSTDGRIGWKLGEYGNESFAFEEDTNALLQAYGLVYWKNRKPGMPPPTAKTIVDILNTNPGSPKWQLETAKIRIPAIPFFAKIVSSLPKQASVVVTAQNINRDERSVLWDHILETFSDFETSGDHDEKRLIVFVKQNVHSSTVMPWAQVRVHANGYDTFGGRFPDVDSMELLAGVIPGDIEIRASVDFGDVRHGYRVETHDLELDQIPHYSAPTEVEEQRIINEVASQYGHAHYQSGVLYERWGGYAPGTLMFMTSGGRGYREVSFIIEAPDFDEAIQIVNDLRARVDEFFAKYSKQASITVRSQAFTDETSALSEKLRQMGIYAPPDSIRAWTQQNQQDALVWLDAIEETGVETKYEYTRDEAIADSRVPMPDFLVRPQQDETYRVLQPFEAYNHTDEKYDMVPTGSIYVTDFSWRPTQAVTFVRLDGSKNVTAVYEMPWHGRVGFAWLEARGNGLLVRANAVTAELTPEQLSKYEKEWQEGKTPEQTLKEVQDTLQFRTDMDKSFRPMFEEMIPPLKKKIRDKKPRVRVPFDTNKVSSSDENGWRRIPIPAPYRTSSITMKVSDG